jgi:hypothetical protein
MDLIRGSLKRTHRAKPTRPPMARLLTKNRKKLAIFARNSVIFGKNQGKIGGLWLLFS